MKKLIVIFAAAVMMTSLAAAQTASGTLNVTATVNSSINLVFNSDPSGVALTSGAKPNAASLDFGNVSAFGAVAPNVTRTATATDFTVSTPVDVLVTSANSASANYTLTATLLNPDPNAWAVNGATFSNATTGTATATGAYGSNVPVTLGITILQSVPSGTLISNTVQFLATAN
ncbi:MAG: hypothetical protein ACM3SW_09555 [Actinomycetota bacterium]